MDNRAKAVLMTAYAISPEEIAQWPSPNYVDPQRRIWVAPFGITLLCITTLVIAVRLYARITRMAGGFGIDDSLIIFAWVFNVLFTTSVSYGILAGGYGLHLWDVPPALGPKNGLVAWTSEVFFQISSCLIKISILLFYRRLVQRTHSRFMQMAIYFAISFTVVYMIATVASLCVVCLPTSSYWESLDVSYTKPYKCINTTIIDPLIVALSVFSDFYSLIIPQVVIRRLKMARREKLMLYGVFASGFVVIGTGLARAIWFSRLYTDVQRDITWVSFEIFFWTLLELQLAMICASAPALKGFLGDFLRDHFSQKSFRSRTAGDSAANEPVSSNKWQETAITTHIISNKVLYNAGEEEISVTESFNTKIG